MKIYNKLFSILVIILFPLISSAQISYSSPYSFLGIGDRVSSGIDKSELIGGSGVALGSETSINNLNPASLYALDSLAVLFNIGLNYTHSNWQSLGENRIHNDASLNYLSLAIKPSDRWGFSAGIVPYSKVGYQISELYTLPGENFVYQKNFSGSGGLSSAFFSSSYSLSKSLSFGITLSEIFGSQLYTEEIIPENLTSYIIEEKRYTNTFYAEYGLNYHRNIGENQISLGAKFGNKKKLSYKSDFNIYDSDYISINNYSTSLDNIFIPLNYNFGVAVNLKNRVIISTDYLFQQWSSSGFDIDNATFMDLKRYSTGVQYNLKNKYQYKHATLVSFFAGAYYQEGFIKMFGERLDEYGFSVGTEIPFNNGQNFIRLGYSRTNFGTTMNSLSEITNNKINLSFTLQDKWFRKRIFE